MTANDGNVTAHVKYKEVEKTFSGNPEEVWLSLDKFFSQFLPTFEIANKLVLDVDLQKLINDCKDLIGFSEEGEHLLILRNKLTDNETLSLLLLANYIADKLGRANSRGISKEDLQIKLGKDAKITSTRLSELIKAQVATKTADEKYRMTSFGVTQMQKDVVPKIRAKITK